MVSGTDGDRIKNRQEIRWWKSKKNSVTFLKTDCYISEKLFKETEKRLTVRRRWESGTEIVGEPVSAALPGTVCAVSYTHLEGSSEAKVIRNTTDKEVAIQISEAKKQAEILEAEGEQEYMKILAEAYGEKDRQEFYSFVRSLDALKNSMTGGDKTVILSADSPIAQIFNGE